MGSTSKKEPIEFSADSSAHHPLRAAKHRIETVGPELLVKHELVKGPGQMICVTIISHGPVGTKVGAR